jgi:hypothetical protein
VSTARSSYGENLRSLVVYLLIYQHVPVARCVELIADFTGGTGPSTGFCHGILARAATAVRETVNLIRALITLSHVVGFDETTLRAGPAGTKRYVLSAVTELYSVFHLGGRDLGSFREFGILPGFTGIAVHDRYQNYDNPAWTQLSGHQACCAHLLRDFTDAAEAHPGAVWPEQAQRALRGLIHAFNQARDAGQAQIAPLIRDPLISCVTPSGSGSAMSRRYPVRAAPPPSHPAGSCWSSAVTAKATSCGSPPTPGSGPRTTSANADCARSRPSRRSPVGSRAKRPPSNAWTSAVTSTPSASTEPTS